jgi:ankyrin repeat protein
MASAIDGLKAAIAADDAAGVAEAMLAGAGVNGDDKWRPLCEAAKGGKPAAFAALRAAGADAALLQDSKSVLRIAVFGGNADLIRAAAAMRAGVDAARVKRLHVAACAADDGAAVLGGMGEDERGAAVNAATSEADRTLAPLHLAAAVGNVAAAAALVDAGAALDAQDANRLTPLTMAAMCGRADAIRMLAARGASANARDVNDWTPLHLACFRGHDDAVTALLDAGADPRARNTDGRTPCDVALRAGHTALGGMLSDVEAAESQARNARVLHFACAVGRVAYVKALLRAGAAVDACDKNEWTPLHVASAKGHDGVVGALLGAGAAVGARTKDQVTPLHLASRYGHAHVVGALLSAPAHVAGALLPAPAHVAVHARDRYQRTPLHVASRYGHVGVVGSLLRAGAAVNARDRRKVTPLHAASLNGHVHVVGALLGGGAAVNARTHQQGTPLHWASQSGHAGIISALVAAGADVAAGMMSTLDTMRSLVSPGVAAALSERADVRFDAITPLHVACLQGHASAAAVLLALGAPLSALDSQGRSPCMYAAITGHAEAFHLLLPSTAAAGLHVAPDALGRSLLHYAAAAASKPIVLALLAAGADPLQADSDVRLPVQLVPNTAAAPIDGDAAKEAIVDALQTAMARLAQARGDAGLLAALTQSRIALPVTADEAITAAQIAACTLQSSDVLEVTRFLGRGTNGKVWAATIRNPDRDALEREVDAVVKHTYWPAAPADAAARAERAFWREVVMQHACRTHRGVAHCFGGFIEPPGADGWVRGTMVMERCAGSLDQAIRSLAGAPQPRAVRQQWAREALAAFAYLHGRDIVHGDIKSLNVLVTADGEVKVTDFGACALRREETAAAGDAAHVGERGSPAYMCPAVALGLEPLRKASDVYSCGVLLWELLSGSAPHGDVTMATVPPQPADLAHIADRWMAANTARANAELICRLYCATLCGLRPASPEQLAALRPAGIGGWIAAMWHPEPRLRPTLEDALPAIAALLGEDAAAWAWPVAPDALHDIAAPRAGGGGLGSAALRGTVGARTVVAPAPPLTPLEAAWRHTVSVSAVGLLVGAAAPPPPPPPAAGGAGAGAAAGGAGVGVDADAVLHNP